MTRMSLMKLIFFGAGEFAASLLRQLSEVHHIALVVTPPPSLAGRRMSSQQCPAAACAVRCRLPLCETVTPTEVPDLYRHLSPELLVVCDYGLLLPPSLLNWTPAGALNLHPSLLPRWRGAAPIERALLAGDSDTGVTIMHMNEKLDAGDIVMQQKTPISALTNGGELKQLLANMGATLMIKTLSNLAASLSASRPQPKEGVCYAAKISPAERALDFNQPADFVARQVRTFAPIPGAHTDINGSHIKVRTARENKLSGHAGEVLAADKNGIVIACKQNSITLSSLQRAGKRELSADEFLRGFPLSVGDKAGIINTAPR